MKLSKDKNKRRIAGILPHIPLVFFTLVALFPIALIVINSFKERKTIFRTPYSLPTAETFSIKGYLTLFDRIDCNGMIPDLSSRKGFVEEPARS